jgi:tRNA dimethylallyltransferase
MTPADPPLIALAGSTASGKHAVALPLAESLGAEIVSVDSMKVYRGMDIGTAKPPAAALARVPHHLIDILDPWESYSAARFVEDAERVIAEIRARGRRPLLVGGTILYLKALLHGLFRGPSADPALRAELAATARARGPEALHAELARVDPAAAVKLHPRDERRVTRALEVFRKTGVPISRLQTSFRSPPAEPCVVAALRWERPVLVRRVEERVDRMLAEGLVEEVRRLLAHPKGMSREALQGHGYKELVPHIEGRETLAQGREATIRNTKLYTRKQMTWLRSFPDVLWVDMKEGEPMEAAAREVVQRLVKVEGAMKPEIRNPKSEQKSKI